MNNAEIEIKLGRCIAIGTCVWCIVAICIVTICI